MLKSAGMMLIACASVANASLPDEVSGAWRVGTPYAMGQPVGLDAGDEHSLMGLAIDYTSNALRVCGQTFRIRTVRVEQLPDAAFLSKYGFLPARIGIAGDSVVDIQINLYHQTKACGDFADPGTHLLLGDHAAAIEVGNDYFRLERLSP